MHKANLLSATALSALICTKAVPPLETTKAYLERMDAVDPKLNGYMTVCRDDARATYPLAYASSAAVAGQENHASHPGVEPWRGLGILHQMPARLGSRLGTQIGHKPIPHCSGTVERRSDQVVLRSDQPFLQGGLGQRRMR
jgi:hypothetical protein